MKQPRINDFDPKANKLSSPLDGMPPIAPKGTVVSPAGSQPAQMAEYAPADEKPIKQTFTKDTIPNDDSNVRSTERTNGDRRTVSRQSYEIFNDQHQQLKRWAAEDDIKGLKGNVSQMVREAIEEYIAKRKRTAE